MKLQDMKVSEKDFDRIVEQAIQRIPPEIREHLGNLVISVRRRPSKTMLKEMGLPEGEPLLGLYQGVSLIERSITSPPLFPDTILLFQEPLQEMCRTLEELEEEIEITIVHEVAHFIGLSEERLVDLGYG
ncbi:MAG: metallopeptidase family protein [Syntrophorhabdus aromaticivorans]|uniref:Metallopeptidase family protein n=2 Tax=Syntrophorhabdus aromaticivorans TaxID=328301 RepID=A0A971S172_9BACT|nr:metallopeptidase family protein [Syntrophorhabdus aromaticivorans]